MVSAYATVSMLEIPLGHVHIHLPLCLFVLMQIGLALLAWKKCRRKGVTRFTAATVAASWALPCCLSWAVFFPGHMGPHVHYNPILFYLGWLPMLFLAIGILTEESLLNRAATSEFATPIIRYRKSRCSVAACLGIRLGRHLGKAQVRAKCSSRTEHLVQNSESGIFTEGRQRGIV
jgi:hypothetical protein